MVSNIKMENAPIYYALAQARFNPITAMDKYASEIQDQLRRQGYTLFQRQEVAQLQLNQVEPTVNQTVSWLMTNENKTAGFILNMSSLTFHTTHYETKKKFIPELLRGLEIVHQVVNLAHINRLGLRYLNAVLPLENETASQYLVAGLHGINFKAKALDYSLHESMFQTDCGPLLTQGRLVARILQVASAVLGYPPGIFPYGLASRPQFAVAQPCSHVIIDIDHFVEGQVALEFNKISEQLSSLHTVLKTAFGSIITKHAQHVWA